MSRINSQGRSFPILLSGGVGVVLILAAGWFICSRGVEATKAAAARVKIEAPDLAPPRLPAPKIPNLPVPKPQ